MTLDEAVSIATKALNTWRAQGNDHTRMQYLNFVSLMNVAIKKADEPVAYFHTLLAEMHYDMENLEEAWLEANKSLSIDPLAFSAQIVKTYIATDLFEYSRNNAQEKKMGFSETINVFSKMTKGFNQGREAGTRIGETIASKRQLVQNRKTFEDELSNLLKVYRAQYEDEIEGYQFMQFSQHMVNLADVLVEHNLGSDEIASMYKLVAEFPLDTVSFTDDQELDEARTLQLAAQGRLL